MHHNSREVELQRHGSGNRSFFLRGFGFAHLFELLAGDGKFVFVPHIVLIGEGIEIHVWIR